MATRHSSHSPNGREAASGANESAATAQSAMADMTRQQMASTASAASAMLRAMENFQQTHQHLLQRTAQLQEQTAQRLRAATSPAEIMAIQSSSLMSGWTEVAQYTQELMLTTLKSQSELMRPLQAQQARQAAEGSAAATPNPAAPFMQAWQAMFNLPAGMYGGPRAGTAG